MPSLLTGSPSDVDASSIRMLHSGGAYRISALRHGHTDRTHQGSFDAAAVAYRYGFDSIPELRATGHPASGDPGRSAMLHDGSTYRLCFQVH